VAKEIAFRNGSGHLFIPLLKIFYAHYVPLMPEGDILERFRELRKDLNFYSGTPNLTPA
jgi:hypothetical protein